MNTATGHYSIIQYCPDPSRLEAANVGVVLFCQELNYLGVRTARGDGRIRRFFGRKDLDRERLHSTKTSIQRRLMIDRDQFTTLAALEQFAATRANTMRLTPFRMVVVPVDAPEAELNRLFDRLVGGRADKEEAPRKSALERALSARALAPLVRRNVTVTLPVFDRRVTVPYGFKNGRFNLIQPARFRNLAPSAILARAGRFAVEGDLLYGAPPDPVLGELRLIVVGQFGEEQQEVARAVGEMLVKNNVELYRLDQLDQLLEVIRTTGQPVVCQDEAS